MRFGTVMYMCAALAVFVSAGCLQKQSDSQPERHERFAGSWVVEQPYHALYEATVYHFDSRGGLQTGATVTADETHDDYVTGSVADPQSGVQCRFASRWYSLDEDTLVIDGNCTDGRYREIVLGFGDDPAANTEDADVVVLSVGGEDGWAHDDWQWRWRRCESADCGLQ